MDTENSRFTCVTCQVFFDDSELQRDHYKNDWHRYNLKRHVAELKPVTFDQFDKLRLSYEQNEIDQEATVGEHRCHSCNKAFQNGQTLRNHIQSKRHKELSKKSPSKQSKAPKKGTNHSTTKDVPNDDDEEEWTDESGDETLLNIEGAIEPDCCFFCAERAPSMERNLQHMSSQHDFYIPDLDYCTDLDGLLTYLGAKVGSGHACLLCNESGKRFRTTDACQKHMRDKGHCRLAHQPPHMLEFADFYDYSSMYDETTSDELTNSSETALNESLTENLLEYGGWRLRLPSGATIGHRSLMLYYRQRLKPESSVSSGSSQKKKRNRDSVQKILGHYRALGWTSTTRDMAVRKAKDMKFMKRVLDDKRLKLSMNQNRLFQFRGRQD